GNGKIKKCG
ncbi:Bifunctional protein FolC, partial [Haemophilus influenzae]